MEKEVLTGWMERRSGRHIIFWACWVIGFTFIKSFGESGAVYISWFFYYLLTLPIFIAHTYLVAYLLIPVFLTKRYLPLFIVLFLLLFYGFSVLELVWSNECIFKWFPAGPGSEDRYLSPGNVIRSGVGNLYIVLVFLAARTIRNWYMADNRKKELLREELQLQVDNAMSRVQPLMLLDAIDHIDRMVSRSSPDVTRAIALISELLSEIMIYHGQQQQLYSKEIGLVKKLVSLISLFRGKKPEIEFFISGDPGQIGLPPMVLFSFIDHIFRSFKGEDEIPELTVEASGYSGIITIQVLGNGVHRQEEQIEHCYHSLQQLKAYYAGNVDITIEHHNFGCSIIIHEKGRTGVNGIHPIPDAVHRA